MAIAPGDPRTAATASSSSAQTLVDCDFREAAAKIDAGLEVPSAGLSNGDNGGRMAGDGLSDSRRRRDDVALWREDEVLCINVDEAVIGESVLRAAQRPQPTLSNRT